MSVRRYFCAKIMQKSCKYHTNIAQKLCKTIRIIIHFYVALNMTIDITTYFLNEISFLFVFYLFFCVLFFFYSYFLIFAANIEHLHLSSFQKCRRTSGKIIGKKLVILIVNKLLIMHKIPLLLYSFVL